MKGNELFEALQLIFSHLIIKQIIAWEGIWKLIARKPFECEWDLPMCKIR